MFIIITSIHLFFLGEKQSFFTLSNQSVVLETVKMVSLSIVLETVLHGGYICIVTILCLLLFNALQCEEDTASVVLRFYEAFGGHACTTVHTTLPVKSLHR